VVEAAKSGEYRHDLDGLRAVAVLMVVLYHAKLPGLTGGFVGVDVFFVISGFLITGLVQRDIERGGFSFLEFYRRRALRLMPNLFAVLLGVMAIGTALLPAADLRELAAHAFATLLYAPNVYLLRYGQYFADQTAFKPLLMTWSLGVEEQFYLVWPALLLLAARLRIKGADLAAAVVGGSFVLAATYLASHQKEVFYLLPTRAWELGLGALLASRRTALSGRAADVISLVGLVAVVGSAAFLDETRPFPGPWALPATIGTALLIAAGPRALAGRALAHPRLTAIGRGSYSLYLWHWPYIAFAHLLFESEGGPGPAAIGVALALGAASAYLAYEYVELPLRHRRSGPAGRILLRYAATSLVASAAALVVFKLDGFSALRDPAQIAADAARWDFSPTRDTCTLRGPKSPDPALWAACLEGGETNPRVAVWGDSHASMLMPGMNRVAADQGWSTQAFLMAGCPPIVGLTGLATGDLPRTHCRAQNAAVEAAVLADPRIESVVVAGRWGAYFQRDTAPAYSHGAGFLDERGRKLRGLEALPLAEELLAAQLGRLVSKGKTVTLVGPAPGYAFVVPRCYARTTATAALIRVLSLEPRCDLPSAHIREVYEPIETMLGRVAGANGARFVSLVDQLCRGERCLTRDPSGELLYYFDFNHMSGKGVIDLISRDERPWLPDRRSNGVGH
jgi:peptidoglycan/LPS O-acetylase OafA/YrhL